ncbi:MAG: SsrA-binding protein SmpB [Anaerolineae bacterium]|jgi:SsrA-binding protein|nr:SsrA-binding protein SmpB [Anaerolineae bacterium]MBT7073960.1 SsrA-binding protein SmpB [Anaerolineae bacterium]MBT7782383.1 SsrA-binding protein SmpB [Anaerolineae bacterium]
MKIKVVSTNRRAKFEYFLEDVFEAGISLKGSEIKSIRAGHISIKEAYIRVDEHEAWLMEAHVAPYAEANRFNHAPRRARQLLLHKKEIKKLRGAVQKKGLTIVPTKVYLKGGRAKIEIALARGKKLHDKRHALKKKQSDREMKREMRY